MNYRPDNEGWANGNVPVHPVIQYFGFPPPRYITLHRLLGISADHGYVLVNVPDAPLGHLNLNNRRPIRGNFFCIFIN